MYLGCITVYVNDVDRAKAFYVDRLGFEVRYDEPMPEAGRWVMLAPPNAQTAIALVRGYGGWSPERVGGDTGHAFEVDDVFATHADLAQRNVEFIEAPGAEYFGGWARFKDSEGNIWGLHSPARIEAKV